MMDKANKENQSSPTSRDSRIRALIEESRGVNPSRLSEIQLELSAWYSTLAEELGNIEVFMADRWLELRKETKSDRMADRLWDATPEGKQRTKLRIQVKFIEKQISSIKRRLDVARQEAWNQI